MQCTSLGEAQEEQKKGIKSERYEYSVFVFRNEAD